MRATTLSTDVTEHLNSIDDVTRKTQFQQRNGQFGVGDVLGLPGVDNKRERKLGGGDNGEVSFHLNNVLLVPTVSRVVDRTVGDNIGESSEGRSIEGDVFVRVQVIERTVGSMTRVHPSTKVIVDNHV
jgi:hypothetical protein